MAKHAPIELAFGLITFQAHSTVAWGARRKCQLVLRLCDENIKLDKFKNGILLVV
jgi:hypothetical protein